MNKITYEERAAVYETAMKKWGDGAQMLVAIEEMAELQKELCKEFRGDTSVQNIADEIADVTIMLEQLRLMFDCNEIVCSRMDYKIQRLKERIAG